MRRFLQETATYQTLFLLLIDTLILYLAFVGALKIRLGDWNFFPAEESLVPALTITLVVYVATFLFVGLYRKSPSDLHLDDYLKVATSCFFAWAISLTVTYFLDPASIPARSVTAAHCVFSLVGVLGLRAAIRYVDENRHGKPVRKPRFTSDSINLDELLPRKPISIDEQSIQNYLSGRTVLVTGAGGSVGSELVKRLITLRPFRLVLVDVSEYNLYQLENEVRKQLFQGELEFRIADVRDERIMRTIFTAFRPDIVFHAAAYKHVPLLERHPVEAFTNNTLSTVSLARLCESFGAEQFVLISTDKAVLPSSVLGATKRMAEWYVRSIDTEMKSKIVRFGNVLGSHGSVVPYFLEQIENDGPITITHPDMTRFFMTGDEACSLILQTLLLDSAPVYTLDMGEPVKIEDLASKMMRQLGIRKKIPIEYSGIRPGEKLFESLWSDDEETAKTRHPDVIGLNSDAPYTREQLDTYFHYLEMLCVQNRTAELRRAFFETQLVVRDSDSSKKSPNVLRAS